MTSSLVPNHRSRPVRRREKARNCYVQLSAQEREERERGGRGVRNFCPGVRNFNSSEIQVPSKQARYQADRSTEGKLLEVSWKNRGLVPSVIGEQ